MSIARFLTDKRPGCIVRRVKLETIRHRLWAWGLCLLLTCAVIGHTCVLPEHSHAMPTRHADLDHHDHADDAVHEASCEAVAISSPVTMSAPPLTDLGIVNLTVEPLLTTAVTPPLASVKARRGPPLFLLHASLLI